MLETIGLIFFFLITDPTGQLVTFLSMPTLIYTTERLH